ncbi:cation diffusion facilitator family transporter [Desulfobacterales bacterium HSG16]|nr:cation diffusion facilitator family transporter [Desulfobacterales bacterium HSG16]
MNSLSFNEKKLSETDKDSDNLNSEIRKARNKAAFSVCLNLFLAVGKGIAGILGNSAALIGDAIHSGADVIASLAAFLGLWLAGKQHPSFPYGLYKAETIATLVTSIVVILAGYEIGRSAILGPISMPDVKIALPVALICLFITFGFGTYQLYAGKKLHSKALEADGKDYLADGLSTVVVVVGLVGAGFGFHVERWAAGAVSLFVFYAGCHLLWRGLLDLMDEAIDRETERKIIALIQAHPLVETVERILSRNAGGRFIVDLDVVLKAKSHDMAHRISHHLEDRIREEFPRVVMARIKTHSVMSAEIRRLVPLDAYRGEPVGYLPRAPWFLLEILDRKTRSVSRSQYIQNPYHNIKKRRGFLVGTWLLELRPNEVVVRDEAWNPAISLLKEAGVELVINN